MEAIILAGGLGTRLRSVVADVPKPMAPVGGKPFLSYILNQFAPMINKFIISVGYKSEVVTDYYGTTFNDAEICYSVEKEPLGTGGAILKALSLITGDTIMVINGDTFFDLNTAKLVYSHKISDVDITLSLKPMTTFDRYGTVIVDNNRIMEFKEKQYMDKGLINGGIYVVNKNVFYNEKLPEKFSFETDFLQRFLKKIKLGAFITDEYFIDIGIPEDYARAQSEMVK